MGYSDVCPERLKAMVQGLRDTFGNRALEVAQKQRDLAADEIAPTWVLIVAALQS